MTRDDAASANRSFGAGIECIGLLVIAIGLSPLDFTGKQPLVKKESAAYLTTPPNLPSPFRCLCHRLWYYYVSLNDLVGTFTADLSGPS
jgi:hypothetical protein